MLNLSIVEAAAPVFFLDTSFLISDIVSVRTELQGVGQTAISSMAES